MASDLSATQAQLAAFGSQLYRAVEALGGGMDVLSIVGSLGDTMPIDDLTGMLQSLNETGSSFEKVLSSDPQEIAEALTGHGPPTYVVIVGRPNDKTLSRFEGGHFYPVVRKSRPGKNPARHHP